MDMDEKGAREASDSKKRPLNASQPQVMEEPTGARPEAGRCGERGQQEAWGQQQQQQQSRKKTKLNDDARDGDQNEEEDDITFLARLAAEQQQEEEGRKARVEAIVADLQHQHAEKNGDDDDDDDVEEEDEEEQQGRVDASAFVPRRPVIDAEEDDLGQSLHRALELYDYESTLAIIEYDPELLSVRNEEFDQPLATAINANFDRGVKLLLYKGCPLHEVDRRGWSALHLAVECFGDMPFLLRYLIQYRGIDIDTRSGLNGCLPLHVVPPNDEKTLRLLLGNGADVSLKDVAGKTVGEVIEETWTSGKAKKKAKQLLTRRAPFQSYMLFKLRFLLYNYSNNKGQQGGASSSPYSAPPPPSPSDTFLDTLISTARSKIIDVHLREHTQCVHAGREDRLRSSGAVDHDDDDEASQIMCREEIPGKVYSYVQDGRLKLARLDGIVNVDRCAAPPTHGTNALSTSLGRAGSGGNFSVMAPGSTTDDSSSNNRQNIFYASSSSSSSSSAATSPMVSMSVDSPRSSPLVQQEQTQKADTDFAAGDREQQCRPVSCCPLSLLKHANAAFFDVGEADEGTKEKDGTKEDDEWVLLPPLPTVSFGLKLQDANTGEAATLTVAMKEEEEGKGEGKSNERKELATATAVLKYVVQDLAEEKVFDMLQGMLWGSSTANHSKRRS